ncbi:MAG: GNAT family N-acetyltransferase [Opitutales bacterium]
MPPPLRIERQPPEQLSPEIQAQVAAVTAATWPGPHPDMLEMARDSAPGDDRRHLRFIGWLEERVACTALIFERTIRAGETALPITALAGVCTHPDLRGQGHGLTMMGEVFAEMDAGRYPVCLYQTDVPGFYEKLGARQVQSTFINSRNASQPQRNPFWSQIQMIYPGNGPWPEAPIDLCGPGY